MYDLVPDAAIVPQTAELPEEALHALSEVLDVLPLAPWNSQPQHEADPDGALRRWPFGPDQAGHVLYLIDEEGMKIHLLFLQWLG
jgi:hypothetical protein